jgi:hypothetical protein
VARALQALVDDCKHTSTRLDTRSSLSELVGAIFETHGETCGAARSPRFARRRSPQGRGGSAFLLTGAALGA